MTHYERLKAQSDRMHHEAWYPSGLRIAILFIAAGSAFLVNAWAAYLNLF